VTNGKGKGKILAVPLLQSVRLASKVLYNFSIGSWFSWANDVVQRYVDASILRRQLRGRSFWYICGRGCSLVF